MTDTTKPERSPAYIVTKPVRLAFASLFEPSPPVKGETDTDKFRYQVTILIPPDVDLTPFKLALKHAAQEKWGNTIPPLKHNPIQPCAGVDYAGFEDGWHFIRLKSKFQPGVVDQRLQQVIDPALVYSGCWAHVDTNAYAYDNQFGKGISFGLNNVQFVRDGDRLDGRAAISDVFEPIEGFETDTPAAAEAAASADDMFAT